MNAEQSKTYWNDRWRKQGRATVGHVGDSQDGFDRQTRVYVKAIRDGLLCSTGRRGGPTTCMTKPPYYSALLDFGCGWGRLYPYLSGLTEVYLGVDLSGEAVRHARDAHGAPEAFGVWDEVRMLEHALRFDAIVCCTVLQHIVDAGVLARTAEALTKMLDEDGRLVLLENVTPLKPKPHIHYRTFADYQNLFPALYWSHLDTVVHKGESHALMVGDK